ncbi:MAG TPA: response regulator transcription factor [Halomicronema sp.]
MIHILLVEDDELFRLGLSVRLQRETGLQVEAEAEDGETALLLAKQHPLEIVLLDVGLPGIGGIETCRQLKEQHPELPVLVLTSRSDKSLIARIIEAGASGYCLKGIGAEALVLAIRSVAAGGSWWDKLAMTEIRAIFCESEPMGTIKPAQIYENQLTKREIEILALLAAGKSNQEIAELLYISAGTVRVHVHAILQKLDVRDRTQAAVLALQKGLING